MEYLYTDPNNGSVAKLKGRVSSTSHTDILPNRTRSRSGGVF